MRIEDIKIKVAPIFKCRAVKHAGVFGSVARGESSPRDIDLLVEMPRPYGLFAFLSLKEDLESALGTKVDLLEYSSIKPALRERVLRDEVAIL